MFNILQCKNVTSKFHRRIEKEGHQIAPLLTDFWRSANSIHMADNILDLRRIDQRVECLEYNGVMDYVADVQLMLKNAVQFCGHSHEVCCLLFLFILSFFLFESVRDCACIYFCCLAYVVGCVCICPGITRSLSILAEIKTISFCLFLSFSMLWKLETSGRILICGFCCNLYWHGAHVLGEKLQHFNLVLRGTEPKYLNPYALR